MVQNKQENILKEVLTFEKLNWARFGIFNERKEKKKVNHIFVLENRSIV